MKEHGRSTQHDAGHRGHQRAAQSQPSPPLLPQVSLPAPRSWRMSADRSAGGTKAVKVSEYNSTATATRLQGSSRNGKNTFHLPFQNLTTRNKLFGVVDLSQWEISVPLFLPNLNEKKLREGRNFFLVMLPDFYLLLLEFQCGPPEIAERWMGT